MERYYFQPVMNDRFFFFTDGQGKMPPDTTIEKNGDFIIIRFKIEGGSLNFSIKKGDQCTIWGHIGSC